jgi:hypothetical protein
MKLTIESLAGAGARMPRIRSSRDPNATSRTQSQWVIVSHIKKLFFAGLAAARSRYAALRRGKVRMIGSGKSAALWRTSAAVEPRLGPNAGLVRVVATIPPKTNGFAETRADQDRLRPVKVSQGWSRQSRFLNMHNNLNIEDEDDDEHEHEAGARALF